MVLPSKRSCQPADFSARVSWLSAAGATRAHAAKAKKAANERGFIGGSPMVKRAAVGKSSFTRARGDETTCSARVQRLSTRFRHGFPRRRCPRSPQILRGGARGGGREFHGRAGRNFRAARPQRRR